MESTFLLHVARGLDVRGLDSCIEGLNWKSYLAKHVQVLLRRTAQRGQVITDNDSVDRNNFV